MSWRMLAIPADIWLIAAVAVTWWLAAQDEKLYPLVFHRHPDWHGHCRPREGDVEIVVTFHLLRGHDGPPLTCAECVAAASDLVSHSCDRLHFHGPFSHRHTVTGR